jgi:transposase
MKYHHSTVQTSVFDFNILQVEIPQDHPLMQVMKEIPWEELVEIVEENYSATTGRNSKSLRMMIGLEIAKHVLRESDEDIARRLKTDIALKVFCGFHTMEHDIPDSSSLTNFRKKLNEETLQKLEAAAMRTFIRKAPSKRRHQVITDSTCMPANITHPYDTKLLAKTWSNLVRKMEKVRATGKDVIIRGRRKVEKALAGFRKTKKKTKKQIQELTTLLIEESTKLLKQLEDAASETVEKTIATAKIILDQQQQMLRTGIRKVKNRIVSFHEPSIRPIHRGKEGGKKVEFGRKITFNCLGGGLLQTVRVDNEAFSDTEMVDNAIETHKRTFGRKPSEMNADRGGHSPQNHQRLKEERILDGIQYRGKIPKNAKAPPGHVRKRMENQRSVVEGKIGTWKTRYGGSRNTYKEEHAHVRITFGLLGMNAKWAAAR